MTLGISWCILFRPLPRRFPSYTCKLIAQGVVVLLDVGVGVGVTVGFGVGVNVGVGVDVVVSAVLHCGRC